MEKEYFTKKEIAERLRCTTRCIEKWMRRGLPHYKFGERRTLFRPSEVDKFVTRKFRVSKKG